MKRLLIMRHAKSSWKNLELDDWQRPLKKKGQTRTALITEFLKHKGIIPDLIISSPAVRALRTAQLISSALELPAAQTRVDEQLYEADSKDIASLINKTPAEVNNLMIIGHNPELTMFSNIFLVKSLDNLPTSGIVCLEFKTDKWQNFQQAAVKTAFVITPKMLKKQNIEA